MQSVRSPSQFDRPDQHPRDSYNHSHPSREQRPPSIFQSRQPSNVNKNKSLRAAVPFNRLQLAAALIEYDDDTLNTQNSGIDWSLQELTSRPLSTHKQAPYSAIFIPFRHTLPSKPLDFFTGLELPAPPNSAGAKSLSGFGIVSETGASRLATTVPGFSPRISGPVIIEDAQATGSRSEVNPLDQDAEVLSEWGLDKVLSGNLETPKLADTAAQDAKPELPTARVPADHEHDRHLVKSDMFDFHFSEFRLHNQEEEEKLERSSAPDFFDDKNNLNEHNPVVDDEAMLRQRVGCDPEGRKLLRPQSRMELEETRQRHRQTKTSTAKQLAALRGRPPPVAQQGFSRINSPDPSRKAKPKSTSRPKSLSPTRAVGRSAMSALRQTSSKITPIRRRSGSGAIQTPAHPSADLLPARGRRKSVLDEPSNRRFGPNPATESVSGPLSPDLVGPNPIPEPKSKGRTSADIAERYQKSIAMLEGRKSEDMAYDVPNQLGSSLGGSQADKDAQGSSRDHRTNLLNQVESTPGSQQDSEFSLGVPKTFTSRFDPKVASVLLQATPGKSLQDDSEPFENRSLRDAGEDDDDGENLRGIKDDQDDATQTRVYDEHGRIRFPASLKPLVLIMPIPLTPAQPEPEEAEELDPEMVAAEEAAQAEKAKLEEIQKLKNVRPAGKLYGRSLIDELNLRKGNQNSKQMAFGANRSPKNFSSSPMHLANQALQTTQTKFSQALIDSSKARKSVFGLDMVMKAELEKLKRIKALEEQELKEEESKIEAKEAKKRAKKKGKKKGAEEEAVKNEEPKDRFASRLSRMDNWDALLERETQPPPIPEPRAPIPLPVLMSPTDQTESLVGDMNNWFKDKANESSLGHTPVMPLSLDLGDDVGFGDADTLARRLELQVEEMKYKPLPNLFESHHMVRPNSVQSQAAFFSRETQGNTPNLLMTSHREAGSDDHGDGEELLLNRISDNNRHSFLPQSLLQPHEEQDDNVPLSYRRKSNFLGADVEHEEEDNRPLSHIGTKLTAGSTLSSSRPHTRAASAHDSDEELPLGIRASILLSKKHPPIDLTHDGSSSEGPIGSVASDESDMVPLGLRSAFLPIPSRAVRPSGRSSSSHEDDFPLAHRVSRMPRGALELQGQHPGPVGTLASSGKSIRGHSDDVPLGVKLHDPRRPSNMNPSFAFPSQAAVFNNPYQTAAPRLFSHPASDDRPRRAAIEGDDGDEEDDVPLAQRASALLPVRAVALKDGSIGLDKGSHSNPEILAAPAASGQPVAQKREPSTMRSPVPSQVVDETVAREDTLAALEGRGNVGAHADDDVPLGVARAAHSTTGSVHRNRTIKRQKDRERNREAAKAMAALEALTQAQKIPGGAKTGEARVEPSLQEEDEDDDDVPLGINAHVINPRSAADGEEEDDVPLGISRHQPMMSAQEAMMQQLLEQQNAAFGFPSATASHPLSLGPGAFGHPMSTMMLPPQNPYLAAQGPHNPASFYPHQLGPQQPYPQQQQQQASVASDGAGAGQDSTISRWRQDVQ